jgi:hypothetical protein
MLVNSARMLPSHVLTICAGPLLLGIIENAEEKTESKDTRTWRSLPTHRDEDQVRLDVDRSFIYYPDSESLIAGVRRLDD